MKKSLLTCVWLMFAAFSLVAAEKERDTRLHSGGGRWGFKKAVSEETKPFHVLLIGDSVMNGYRDQVARDLGDAVACAVWLTPAHLNSKGLCEDLGQIVSGDKYDVIHFNIGLHGWPQGRIPEGQYDPLLRKYVDVLLKDAPQAKLIWASTTPIMTGVKPIELDPQNNPTIVKRNAIAAKVMDEKGIAINDLYSVMSRHLTLGADKFHWSAEGKRIQADHVVESIKTSLNASGTEPISPESVVYKSVAGKELLLDVYRPASKEKMPVFIMVHGGGWTGGARNANPQKQIGQELSKEGIAVVSIDYRLLGRDASDIISGTFDRAMEDIADAYEWIRQHADTYRFDLDRVGIGGGSAGGHLSSIFAQQCPGIRYFVGICGQYDLSDMGQSSFPSPSLQGRYGIHGPSAQKRASAMYNIRKNPPITLLMHGTADNVIDCHQAIRFGKALEANGGKVTIKLFEGRGHGFFNATLNDDHGSLAVMTEFLKEVMLTCMAK